MNVVRYRWKSPADRLWPRLDRSNADGCWRWTGAGSGRYGVIMVHGKAKRPHRLAWELTHGPIPPGVFVCHHCDVPTCCRPEHLFLGTAFDNMKDASAKGRLAAGVRHGSRLHPDRLARGSRHNSVTRPDSVLRGERHWKARLAEKQVRDIRQRCLSPTGTKMPYGTYAALGREYGVTPEAIFRIVARKAWAHVE